MSEEIWKVMSQVFSSIPDWVWYFTSIVFFLYPVYMVFRSILFPSSLFGFSFSDLHLKRRFTNLLCKSNFGFKIAYKLGLAERGVHFFHCGEDCHICPKKDTCDHSCS